MDKAAIKTYAIDARRKLIEAVRQKAFQLYIFEDGALPSDEANRRLRSDGIFLSPEQDKSRLRLCNELAALAKNLDSKAAHRNMMENIACTWFNRLIALRIMEVNGWLPSGVRVLSSLDEGRIEPDAVREAERLDYVNQAKITELRADTSINASEKLYKYILISQCNALSAVLPGMFEKENDNTELLLPDALLSKGGIVHDLVNIIHEDNFNVDKQGQIEIVGWLYQFYISEKKDEVFAGLKKNIKINKDTIPAATQLFTPEWIVKYMVENSLGRLWLERARAESGLSDEYMNASYYGWKYYVDEAEQEPEVAEQLRVLRSQGPVKRPEDIKLIDPCMGSGHILVYAFDVLFQIYQSEGYSEREIPNLILRHNIYGLDIDDRAGQLAYFALMIKARSYSRRFFRQDSIPQPMVYAVPETKPLVSGLDKRLGASMAEGDRTACFEDLKYLAELFGNGKEYGSALKIEREIDFDRLRKYVRDFSDGQMTFEDTDFLGQADAFERVIDVAELLTQKYDVVVTNPPYMAPAPSQADWVKKNYPNSKSDLCVVFIERNFDLLRQNGYLSMITMHSWMFLSSYEKFREKLIDSKDIVNMAHLGARAFEEIGGEVVQTTAFVMRCSDIAGYLGTYVRLVDYVGQQAKENAFLARNNRFASSKVNIRKIPGCPVAYWIGIKFLLSFDNAKINTIAQSKCGMNTGNNDIFVRYWFEINSSEMRTNCKSITEFHDTGSKYTVYNKGGERRKWYGNNDYLLKFNIENFNILAQQGNKLPSRQFYFKPCLTWSDVTTSGVAFRFQQEGSVFDGAAAVAFINENKLLYTLGFLNSKIVNELSTILNPTLHFKLGDFDRLPYIEMNRESVENLVNECIIVSKTDWDSFETSWDFKKNPLVTLRHGYNNEDKIKHIYIYDAFVEWESDTDKRFAQLKSNETELNRIFIEIYGLQDELTPEVEDKDVTVRKADLSRDIRSFLSYAVGCIFGRYSLDEPGLVFAGGEFDISRYKTFIPEDDNIIPIGSADYFDDDIVIRVIEFVRIVYGDNTLGENLNFIADALYPNGNGSAQERLRRYFLNDFYKDHVRIYQKKPIYWLLDSGKKDGFKALFYLHRYDKYTVARVRTDYLHPLQRKYESEIKRLEMLSGGTDNAREKAAYRKETDVLQGKLDECRVYDQVASHIAHQQLELDLDDGVKVNYAKFQGVEVPKDNGKTVIMDLMAKL